METNTNALSPLEILSRFDICQITTQGQKYIFTTEGIDKNKSLIFSEEELKEMLSSLKVWLSDIGSPLPPSLLAFNDIDLFFEVEDGHVYLDNVVTDEDVELTKSFVENLTNQLNDLSLLEAHTSLDAALIHGYTHRIPVHQIEKAFKWCEEKKINPLSLDENQNPQWLTVLKGIKTPQEFQTQAPASIVTNTPNPQKAPQKKLKK